MSGQLFPIPIGFHQKIPEYLRSRLGEPCGVNFDRTPFYRVPADYENDLEARLQALHHSEMDKERERIESEARSTAKGAKHVARAAETTQTTPAKSKPKEVTAPVTQSARASSDTTQRDALRSKLGISAESFEHLEITAENWGDVCRLVGEEIKAGYTNVRRGDFDNVVNEKVNQLRPLFRLAQINFELANDTLRAPDGMPSVSDARASIHHICDSAFKAVQKQLDRSSASVSLINPIKDFICSPLDIPIAKRALLSADSILKAYEQVEQARSERDSILAELGIERIVDLQITTENLETVTRLFKPVFYANYWVCGDTPELNLGIQKYIVDLERTAASSRSITAGLAQLEAALKKPKDLEQQVKRSTKIPSECADLIYAANVFKWHSDSRCPKLKSLLMKAQAVTSGSVEDSGLVNNIRAEIQVLLKTHPDLCTKLELTSPESDGEADQVTEVLNLLLPSHARAAGDTKPGGQEKDRLEVIRRELTAVASTLGEVHNFIGEILAILKRNGYKGITDFSERHSIPLIQAYSSTLDTAYQAWKIRYVAEDETLSSFLKIQNPENSKFTTVAQAIQSQLILNFLGIQNAIYATLEHGDVKYSLTLNPENQLMILVNNEQRYLGSAPTEEVLVDQFTVSPGF